MTRMLSVLVTLTLLGGLTPTASAQDAKPFTWDTGQPKFTKVEGTDPPEYKFTGTGIFDSAVFLKQFNVNRKVQAKTAKVTAAEFRFYLKIAAGTYYTDPTATLTGTVGDPDANGKQTISVDSGTTQFPAGTTYKLLLHLTILIDGTDEIEVDIDLGEVSTPAG